ncbi:zinc finger protein, partial [Striga asiatica]
MSEDAHTVPAQRLVPHSWVGSCHVHCDLNPRRLAPSSPRGFWPRKEGKLSNCKKRKFREKACRWRKITCIRILTRSRVYLEKQSKITKRKTRQAKALENAKKATRTFLELFDAFVYAGTFGYETFEVLILSERAKGDAAGEVWNRSRCSKHSVDARRADMI